MNEPLEPWIETFGGKRMYFLEPDESMIDIGDIAHSLSLQCRFSGHTSRFYSVAEHSNRVSKIVYEHTLNPRLALQGLLHDATEAYLLDVPSPIKRHLGGYYDMEAKLESVILNKFHAGYPLSAEVKEADSVMLKNEAYHLLPSQGKSWVGRFPTSYEYFAAPFCFNPTEANDVFLSWFFFLEKQVNEQRNTITA